MFVLIPCSKKKKLQLIRYCNRKKRLRLALVSFRWPKQCELNENMATFTNNDFYVDSDEAILVDGTI